MTITNKKSDIIEDFKTPEDRGELTSLIEPLCIAATAHSRTQLDDLALTLVAKNAGLRQSLPHKLVPALATLVRGMNCYYSNLIEGHNTHPIDIERALKNDYSPDIERRNLQLEAKAHISVQEWIDNGGLKGRSATTDSLLEIHRKFYELLPDELLWAEDPKHETRIRVTPGKLRNRDVRVGRHVPVSPGAVPRFLKKFEHTYQSLGLTETIINAASAHHRLLWIHPFLDGNGRVARLFSHAMLMDVMDTGGLWSISRGLARDEQRYKELLINCDLSRRNDIDGRGNLSEEALAEFSHFFLGTCLDQVTFMADLIQPERLKNRILSWVDGQNLPAKSGRLLAAIIYKGGEITRKEAAEILDVGERQTRRILLLLTKQEILTSESLRSPLRLKFSARLAGQWLPGLFPEPLNPKP